MALIKVAQTNELQPGGCKIVTANGRDLALYNIGGTFHATDNTCPHKGGPLGEGELDGTTITCPWHGWRYDVTTGQCKNNPAARVAPIKVEVQGADVFVDL
ncbi:MAG: non-heme iron oxygenase ferredoxin subunit [Verrucomicrobia bacterium]|nr:non-heme iron oxygenase ferredoxin subunit [Verrucomicrobiota bacterium]